MHKYSVCLNCWHFVEENLGWDDDASLAKWIHLDDGEKEHLHDAVPDMEMGEHELSWWRMNFPTLFLPYPDNKIGPNSRFFEKPYRRA